MSTDEEAAVKIAVRERPFIHDTTGNEASVVNYHSTNKNIIIVNERPYEFDYCLGPEVTQKQLYDELVKPLVQKTLQGYFCTALAYGQTGTGKTFTMGLHSEYFSGAYVGVVPRSLEDVFHLTRADVDGPEIAVSFVEIYNEKVYDLLADDTNEQANVKGFKFGGGKKVTIKDEYEGLAALQQGNKCRHIRPTKMNPESSRSHAIFTIHVSRKTVSSLLHLVDLAGSEGVRRTGHQGLAFAEGIHINKGLLSIRKVLQALASKQKVIPYRDSVLSSVLQDSLKPNSYLTLLACISPLQEDLSETMSTLRFAADAKFLKHNPQINVILQEIQKNKSRTPHKSFHMAQSKTPTALKKIFTNGNNGAISTIRKPFHSNTFCTPNTMRNIRRRPLNQTDIGLTPKEKMKYDRIDSRFSSMNQGSKQKSDYNESIDSRSSIISMNASTSTLLDVPVAASNLNTNSFSPIVRRCETLETKIEKMFEYMKEMYAVNKENIKQPCESALQIGNQSIGNGLSLTAIKNELQNIVREEILHMTASNTILCKTNVQQIIPNNPEDTLHLQVQSFAESSPVSKLPDLEKRLPHLQNQPSHCETFKQSTCLMDQTSDTIFFQSSRIGDSTMANETVVQVKRRSRRLSNMSETGPPVRRSMRIERRNSLKPAHEDDSFEAMQVSCRRKSANSFRKERRESIRRSMRIEKRMSMMPIRENIEVPQIPKKRLGKKVPINNKTLSEYFQTQCTITKPKTKKQTKDAFSKHEKAVLDLLNTGNIREIQILPQIGLKTAYQLITQRTLNGKFRNFDQVSKLPIWRGRGWERFKVANSIS